MRCLTAKSSGNRKRRISKWNRSSLYKQNKKAYNSFIKYLIKEGKKTENKDKRNIARKKIINYVLNNSVTSKAELAKELNLSMPTVLANVNDLLEKMEWEEIRKCAVLGNAVAGLCVQKRGGIPAIPTKEAVLEFMQK